MRTGTLHVLFGFFAALFVASQANIVVGLGPMTSEMLHLQTTLSADTFRGIVEGWNAEELNRYQTHFAWDSVHPLIYGTFLMLWTLVAHRRRPFSSGGVRMLVILAVATSVLDYVENAFHLYLAAHRQSINDSVVALAGGVGALKWLCGGLLFVLLVLASVRATLGSRRGSLVGTVYQPRPVSESTTTVDQSAAGKTSAGKPPAGTSATVSEPERVAAQASADKASSGKKGKKS